MRRAGFRAVLLLVGMVALAAALAVGAALRTGGAESDSGCPACRGGI